MTLVDEVKKWKNKKILLIGEALIDKYIFGMTDRISPDAPVPNVKIEKNEAYLGGIGLVLKYIKSLGGIPEICTVIGNDYEGDYFLKEIKKLNINSSGILIEDSLSTPQITRIKAMNQHLLRLETDYSSDISEAIYKKFLKIIESSSQDIDSILILDYGIGGLFKDVFIQKLLETLEEHHENIPIIARPNQNNYYIYENIDLIKINLQKALKIFSIDCSTKTSISIVGKKILNSSKCKNVLLNYLESDSYLFSKDVEQIEQFTPILQEPVFGYVAVGSVIMGILGLALASKISVFNGVKIALFAAALTASLPPVDFYTSEKLCDFILEYLNKK